MFSYIVRVLYKSYNIVMKQQKASQCTFARFYSNINLSENGIYLLAYTYIFFKSEFNQF